ncbi:MAG: PH domain-containing protein [Candidatus Aenigmatarchaeota archaeon]|nr:MAG: PH domain-containing protein [Candidatus Aenigmarchaeota archaeon]
MPKAKKVVSGKEFSPLPSLKSVYYVQIAVILFFALFTWYLPVVFFEHSIASVILSVFVWPTVIVAAIWVPKYYRTMKYRLGKDEIEWARGVWFRNTGIVPYNRITNVDISQGPLSRMFGLFSLKIQTAGYSANASSPAEIKIEGIDNPEEIRDIIIGFVRGRKPVASETYGYPDGSSVLKELVKIRKLLEKGAKR